jgi:tRNA nucleotidyltransferase/poly(A) polymerase
MPSPLSTLLASALEVTQELRIPTYVVGGGVRDLLCGGRIFDTDIDLVVEGDSASCAYKISERLPVSVQIFSAFLTVKVMYEGAELDIASTRKEAYERPGALPRVVYGTLDDDAFRRDFSVNALYVPFSKFLALRHEDRGQEPHQGLIPYVVDKVNGLRDVHSRCIRVLHEKSFIDDPTRMYRAARYCSRLKGALHEATMSLLRSAIDQGALESISLHRRLTEIRKALVNRENVIMYEYLQEWGLLEGLPFIPSGNQSQPFFAALVQLYTLDQEQVLSKDVLFDVILRLCTVFSASLDEDIIRALALPRKRMKAFREGIKKRSLENDLTRLLVDSASSPTHDTFLAVLNEYGFGV